MPLGKYYCDYCDKQFQDTAASRRRHLQGIAHQRAKSLWYDAARSSSQLSSNNEAYDPLSMEKGVCNRFLRTGSCKYGDSCKYYHPKKSVQNMNAQGVEGTGFGGSVQSQGIPDGPLVYPALFGNHMGNLPPSLWPTPDGGYLPLPFIDWG